MDWNSMPGTIVRSDIRNNKPEQQFIFVETAILVRVVVRSAYGSAQDQSLRWRKHPPRISQGQVFTLPFAYEALGVPVQVELSGDALSIRLPGLRPQLSGINICWSVQTAAGR
jgi:hypothetical protein